MNAIGFKPANLSKSNFGPAVNQTAQLVSDNDSQCSDGDDEQQQLAVADDNGEDDNPDTSFVIDRKQWENRSFLFPLHMLNQLSGFPNLLMLYSILCCLPVSSASAERALSKLKIVKNRLRTSLSDNTMSSLLILASEKDMLVEISNEDIINQMAVASPSLKSLLLF